MIKDVVFELSFS